MGLDITPLLPNGEEIGDEFWPRQHLHYTWSHFRAIMIVIEHNAILTGVATKDDPTVILMREVKTGDTWTTEQCRDVHTLIRKTINASTFESDPQTLIAMKEHIQMVTDFQQAVSAMTGVGKSKEDAEEDSMNLAEEDTAPCAWLKRPPTVILWYCRDPDSEVIEFGETMAVFFANGWGAGFY